MCQMFKLIAHRQISNGNEQSVLQAPGSHACRPALTASDDFFSLPLIGAALAWFVCPPAQSAHAAEAVFGTKCLRLPPGQPRPQSLGGSLNLAKRYRNFAHVPIGHFQGTALGVDHEHPGHVARIVFNDMSAATVDE